MDDVLKEARRLFDMGFACHWIKAQSKAPVKSGWSGANRDSWETLKRDYRQGYGLGVRLGEASKMADGFLAVIDVDVKSTEQRHRDEAFACVRKYFPKLFDGKKGAVPTVLTGRGNDSSHIYVKTKTPLQSRKLGSSGDDVEVYSPSSPVSPAQERILPAERLKAGWRLKKAWEVELMSKGKQVVLPPTLHADTGDAYYWKIKFNNINQLHLIEAPAGKAGSTKPGGISSGPSEWRFEPIDVDLVGSRLSDRIVDMVLMGKGVSDRSAALMSATLAMVSAGFSDVEILSALTDQGNFLGQVAYEHRKTDDRKNAAAWIRDYTLAKARRESSAAAAFAADVEIAPQLTDDEAAAQTAELIGAEDDENWKDRLDRSKGQNGEQGTLRATLKNVLAILEHTVGRCIFKRDAFSFRDSYAMNTPWGGKYGALINDDDAIAIKVWFAKKWKIEPNTNIVFEAISHILMNNSFHPVRQYLASLPEWDGTERVDSWLKECLGATGPEPYVSDVSRKVLLAAVTRIYQPGAKFDHMLILEGKQGIGKSSIGRIMAGEEWFLDGLPDLSDKDAALGLLGQWFVEMPELTNFKRSEVETIKAFVTRQIDKVRPPYGRKVMELKRQCVFFGSTNSSFYLVDKTGNRRFWPIKVMGQLDFAKLAAIRDQLFAEAKWIYDNIPEPLYLEDTNAKAQAEAEQESKVSEDEESAMGEALDSFRRAEGKKPKAERFDFTGFKLTDLFNGFGPFADLKSDSFHMQTAGRVLKVRNFERIHTMKGKRWRQIPS